MKNPTSAIYEDGVFKPLEPVSDLSEPEPVQLVIQLDGLPGAT